MKKILVLAVMLILVGCETPKTTENTYEDCTVVRKDKSVVKILQPSSILSNNLSASNVCEIAQSVADKEFNLAVKSLSNICEPVDTFAQEVSNGNYKEASEKFTRAQLPNSEVFLGLLHTCSSHSSRLEHVTKTLVHANIYSFGTFRTNGKECPGYLTQTTILNETGKDIKTQVYFLYGYGKCDYFKLDKIDNPVEKPDSVLPGDILRNTYKYDGLLPENWIFESKPYHYYTVELELSKNAAKGAVVDVIETNTSEALPIAESETVKKARLILEKAIKTKSAGSYELQFWLTVKQIAEECKLELSEASENTLPQVCTDFMELGGSKDADVLFQRFEHNREIGNYNYIYIKHHIDPFDYVFSIQNEVNERVVNFGESNSAQTSSSINTSATSKSEPTPPAISASTFSTRYADKITSNFSSSSICNNYKNMIYQMTEGNIPENIKIMKIDKIFDTAFKYRCVPY